MRKLINDPRHVVREMLEGSVDLQPGLALLAGEDVVVRAGLGDRALGAPDAGATAVLVWMRAVATVLAP